MQGGFTYVAPLVDEASGPRLSKLQAVLALRCQQPAGLNPKSFRLRCPGVKLRLPVALAAASAYLLLLTLHWN